MKEYAEHEDGTTTQTAFTLLFSGDRRCGVGGFICLLLDRSTGGGRPVYFPYEETVGSPYDDAKWVRVAAAVPYPVSDISRPLQIGGAVQSGDGNQNDE